MTIKYAHTNVIAKDWKRLVTFYQNVFDCIPVPPMRDQQGGWLEKGTGVERAHLQGMHLRLPGHGDSGPTLEIYTYSTTVDMPPSPPNQRGFGHLAFLTDDIQSLLKRALDHGATKVGEISECKVEGVGHLTFIYIADPERNVIELQNWS